jgi:hypothetical protein
MRTNNQHSLSTGGQLVREILLYVVQCIKYAGTSNCHLKTLTQDLILHVDASVQHDAFIPFTHRVSGVELLTLQWLICRVWRQSTSSEKILLLNRTNKGSLKQCQLDELNFNVAC